MAPPSIRARDAARVAARLQRCLEVAAGLRTVGCQVTKVLTDIEEAAGEEKSRRRFASEHLAGSFRLGGRPAINTRVREQLARRALGRENTR